MVQLKNLNDFNKISPTALICAKIRAEYTSLPYAKEIYKSALKEKIKWEWDEIIDSSFLKNSLDIPLVRETLATFEMTYLSINDAINNVSDYSILEFSSGLSPRFLEFSNKCFYLETDLSSMTFLKRNITNKIAMQKSKKFNLENILPLNPLNLPELLLFGNYFKSEDRKNSFAIINEGLMMYLSTNEQEQLRDNIALFLQTYFPQGFWITTDFSPRSFEKNTLVNSVMEKVEKETGKKFNRFKDEDSVYEFLSKGNLKCEALPNYHLIEKLSCLKKLKITKDEIVNTANLCKAWKIMLK